VPVNGDKLYKLLEQALNNKDDLARPRGLVGYRNQVRELLGICEGPGGEPP